MTRPAPGPGTYVTRRASTVCLYSESNTGAGSICRQRPSEHCPENPVFDELVLKIPLWDFDARLQIDRYMYDLDSDKGARRLKYLARSLSRPKLRIHDTFLIYLMFCNKNHSDVVKKLQNVDFARAPNTICFAIMY